MVTQYCRYVLLLMMISKEKYKDGRLFGSSLTASSTTARDGARKRHRKLQET